MNIRELEQIRHAERTIAQYEYELFLLKRHSLFTTEKETPEQRAYINLIFRQMANLYNLKIRFLQEIDTLTANERNVVKYYYFDGVETWDKVAQKMFYSKDHVYTFRRDALQKLERIKNGQKKEGE